MLRIARIRPAGRRDDLRTVTLADGRRFLLDAEQIAGLGLAPEAPVDDGLHHRLAALDEHVRAREAALLLLRYRLRSRAELEARLQRRRFPPAVVRDTITELAERGLLDDARFARMWAEYRAGAQSGPHRVRAELRRRGVASDVIEEAVQSVFAGQEADLAAALAERHARRLSGLPEEVRLRRLAGLLQRRGFSGRVIAPLLRRFARAREGRASETTG
jgi:regulatory protein